MDDLNAQTVDPIIKACLFEIHAKLREAEQVARAASACAEAGSTNEAVRVSMDLEQLVYDVGRLQDTACLLARRLKV